jgi:hypothetical protein
VQFVLLSFATCGSRLSVEVQRGAHSLTNDVRGAYFDIQEVSLVPVVLFSLLR